MPKDPVSSPVKLTMEAVSKTYTSSEGNLTALSDVTLDVHEEEFLCVLGPSGCGKTTLLWGISGLHPFTSGLVTIDGQPTRAGDPQMAMIFQDPNLLPWRSLIKNIRFPHELRRTKLDEGQLNELLSRVGLEEFKNRFPHELSGGMQQRASIVRALCVQPNVLLMDEPFSALDAFTRDEMNMLIQDIWMDSAKTVVFITHSIYEAVTLADRVVVLSSRPGRVHKVFPVDLDRPRTLDVQTQSEFISLVKDIKEAIRSA